MTKSELAMSLAAIVFLFSVAAIWRYANYVECRFHGFSQFYCLTSR